MNPVPASCPLVTELFPSGVVSAALRGAADPAHLFLAERELMHAAAPMRMAEFAAGRRCAREAMSVLGLSEMPLLMAEDRSPQWPEGIAGSISHTGQQCVAIVAQCSRFRSLGVDIETVSAVTEDVWPQIMTVEEQSVESLRSKLLPEQFAAAMFAAKEAFFKCQFPVYRQWLEFDQVAIRLTTIDNEIMQFSIHLQDATHASRMSAASFAGALRFHDELVLAGVWMPASNAT